MYLVAVAWLYVVVLMALAEGTAVNGSWLGATITLALYGLFPLAIALYLLNTPARRAARRRADVLSAGRIDPDGGGHPAGDAVAAKREEP
jgi:NADH:ubiquinone oxidoreductase subunit 6 (subunit J)